MSQANVNVGTSPGAGNGDSLYNAFSKINNNFTELYSTITSSGITYANIAPSVDSSASGSGLTLNITKYANIYGVSVNLAGTGYALGESVRVWGNVVGGSYTTHDLIVEVGTLANSSIGSVGTVTFTGTPSVPLRTVAGRTGDVVLTTNDIIGLRSTFSSNLDIQNAVDGKIASNIANLIGTAPGVLDTLGEIADALNDDANVYNTLVTTITTANVNLKGYTDDLVTTGNTNMKGYVDSVANLTFYNNSNVQSYLSSFDGNIIPSANVTYSLGDPTHQWKDLYLSGNTMYIGGATISVSGGYINTSLPFSGNITTSNLTVTGTQITFSQGAYIDETELIGAPGKYGLALNSADDGIVGMNALDSNANIATSVIASNTAVTINTNDSSNVLISHSWIFEGNSGTGSLLWPDSTVQTTAWNSNANAAIIGYVDSAVSTANVNLKGYVDAEIIAIGAHYSNTEVLAYLTDNSYATETYVTTANTNLKGYTDNKFGTFTLNSGTNTVTTSNGDGNLKLAINGATSDDPPALITKQWSFNTDGTISFNDPFTGNPLANGVVSTTKIGQWNEAYGWGDHSTQGYGLSSDITTANVNLKGYVDGEITTLNSTITTANTNVVGYVDSAVSTANVNLKGYTDDQFTTGNTNVVGYVDSAVTTANVNLKGYVDSEISDTVSATGSSIAEANINMRGYVDGQVTTLNSSITTANVNVVGYIDNEISTLIGGAPGTLDTLNEIAAALGDDPNLATTLTNTITSANLNMKGYVDGQVTTLNSTITTANTNVVGYVDSAVSTANVNLKGYVDSEISGLSLGNISTITLDGNVSNVLAGDGTFITAGSGSSSYTDANVNTLLASWGSNTLSTTGNVATGKITITASGTIGQATPANGYLQVTDGANTLAFDPNEIYSTSELYIKAVNGISLIGNVEVGGILTDNYYYANGAPFIGGGGSSYTNSDVDAHLNQSNPTSGYVLSWNGSDYAWIDNAGYTDSDVNTLLASWGSNSLSTTGNVTAANFIGNVTGTTANVTLVAGVYEWTFDTAGNVLFANGTVSATTVNAVDLTLTGNIDATVNGFDIGYKTIPQVSAGNVTIALSDSGKHYYSTASDPTTLTIPLNSSVAFDIGTAISIVNQGTGNISVAPTGGVSMYLAGNATSASRTITSYGMATLMKVATDTWFINGTGVN